MKASTRMEHPFLQPTVADTLDAHWAALCAGAGVPRRADINPSALHGALDHLLLLERPTEGPARLRIGGMQVCALMGHEVRGLPLRTLFVAESTPQIDACISQLLETPCLIDATLLAEQKDGQTVPGVLILRPLQDGSGHVTRAIGALVFELDIARCVGARLRLVTVTERPLSALTGLPERRKQVPEIEIAHLSRPKLKVVNTTEQPEQVRPATKCPHLRLVANNCQGCGRSKAASGMPCKCKSAVRSE
jgi:hypothetical protein